VRDRLVRPNLRVLYEHVFDGITTSLPDARADQRATAPLRRDYDDDSSHALSMAAPRSHDSHHDMSSVLERLDRRVDEIEAEIATIAPLVHERARLLRARAAIRGERESDLHRPALQRRITRADVFEYLARHPGSRAGEVAAGLGVGQAAVSAHLYRGKGQLFARIAERWYPVPAAENGAGPTPRP
jgi:hypothetical protein